MAAVPALARLAITLGGTLKHLAAAAGALVAITVAGRNKRRMVGDGDGIGLGCGGIINQSFYDWDTIVRVSRRPCSFTGDARRGGDALRAIRRCRLA